MSNELREFLRLSYNELEDLNLEAKEQRLNRVPMATIREERLKYLTDEKRIKAVTVMFSDLEGRLHMLDYDKKFLLKSWDNLTFDGSAISRLHGPERKAICASRHRSVAPSSWGRPMCFCDGKGMVSRRWWSISDGSLTSATCAGC